MLKRTLILFIIFVFTLNSAVPVFAQGRYELEQFIKTKMKESDKKDNEKVSAEEAGGIKQQWQRFTCPVCEREFQIPLSDVTEEISRGIENVICPYDGTNFIPREAAMRKALKQDPEYVSIVSPYEKKEFKAKVDMDSIAAGAVITDPYTGKKFRYVPETVEPWEEWQEVTSPADGRKFRVRFFPQQKYREISSPYDGSKFLPEWQLIPQKDRLSDIEKMFSREIPIAVSKAIRQFGYDLFPEEPLIKRIGDKEKKETAEKEYSEDKEDKAYSKLALLEKGAAGKDGASMFEEGVYGGLTTIPVSDDYVLGPGDKLILNLWGNIQQNFELDIDGEGKIMLPQAGPLYLWGARFSEAKKLIAENLYKYYTNFQINVSMGKLRSIKVFILGEAKKPGAYMASSLTTLFDILYQAGGPSKIGGLRKIRLTRANKTEEAVDLYSYLLGGDKTQDFKLDSNDTIFIPPIGAVAGIAGNVKRPAVYELKDDNLSLAGLLDMAGGISAVGYLQRIQVERIKDHQRKIVFDLDFENAQKLKASAGNILLQDGDLVLVSAVTPVKHNYVSIAGHVTRPGDYELKPAMKIRDLIEQAEGVMPGAYTERAELSHFRDDKTREIFPVNLGRLFSGDETENMELKEWDRLYVFTKSEVIPVFFIRIEGAVYRPGEYELTENMRLSDLIFRAGGLKKTASLNNAELYRRVLGEAPKVIPIDLAKIFDPRTRESDLYLQEGDQFFIREETKWLTYIEAVLTGEFAYPGKYAAAPGERLSSVIKRAGGFSDNAFLQGAVFTRKSVEKYQREMIKKFIDAEQEAMLKEESSLALGLSDSQSEARKEMINYRQKQLSALESAALIGRVVIKLDKLDAFEGSASDVVLEDGDTLIIPSIPSSVQVLGNVRAPNAITYIEGRGVDYYISRAGGFTRNADKNGIFIIKPSGEALDRFTQARKIERGDTIIVPEVFKYKTPAGLIFKDAFSFTSQLVVTVLALSAVK